MNTNKQEKNKRKWVEGLSITGTGNENVEQILPHNQQEGVVEFTNNNNKFIYHKSESVNQSDSDSSVRTTNDNKNDEYIFLTQTFHSNELINENNISFGQGIPINNYDNIDIIQQVQNTDEMTVHTELSEYSQQSKNNELLVSMLDSWKVHPVTKFVQYMIQKKEDMKVFKNNIDYYYMNCEVPIHLQSAYQFHGETVTDIKLIQENNTYDKSQKDIRVQYIDFFLEEFIWINSYILPTLNKICITLQKNIAEVDTILLPLTIVVTDTIYWKIYNLIHNLLMKNNHLKNIYFLNQPEHFSKKNIFIEHEYDNELRRGEEECGAEKYSAHTLIPLFINYTKPLKAVCVYDILELGSDNLLQVLYTNKNLSEIDIRFSTNKVSHHNESDQFYSRFVKSIGQQSCLKKLTLSDVKFTYTIGSDMIEYLDHGTHQLQHIHLYNFVWYKDYEEFYDTDPMRERDIETAYNKLALDLATSLCTSRSKNGTNQVKSLHVGNNFPLYFLQQILENLGSHEIDYQVVDFSYLGFTPSYGNPMLKTWLGKLNQSLYLIELFVDIPNLTNECIIILSRIPITNNVLRKLTIVDDPEKSNRDVRVVETIYNNVQQAITFYDNFNISCFAYVGGISSRFYNTNLQDLIYETDMYLRLNQCLRKNIFESTYNRDDSQSVTFIGNAWLNSLNINNEKLINGKNWNKYREHIQLSCAMFLIRDSVDHWLHHCIK